MEDIIMIFTEERSATIKFGSRFTHVDYVKDTKDIHLKFNSSEEAASFKYIIMNIYIKIYSNLIQIILLL